MNFHLITHAVCAAIIATLVRKYFYVIYQYEELEILYDSCTNHIERTKPQDNWQQDSAVGNSLKSHVEEKQTSFTGGFGEKMSEFDNTQEMQYFYDYSESEINDQTVDDYTGTQFSQASQNVPISSVPVKSKSIQSSSSSSFVENLQSDKPTISEKVKSNSDVSHTESNVPFTSVWCHGSSRNDRSCHFRNLCYHTKHQDFIFFQHRDSLKENVPDSVNFQSILDLSSVADHNLHQLSVTKLPHEAMNNFRQHWINRTSLLFNRFKPDNIMHILHDDVFPLIYTLQQITFNSKNSTMFNENDIQSRQRFDVQLVAMEGWEDEVDFPMLYDILSQHKLLTKENLKNLGELVCFQDTFVGISKSTTWYQYGFHKPQGPLDTIRATGSQIHQCVSYILAHTAGDCQLCTAEYLVLLSRKNNRLILNEMDLSLAIAQNIGMRVMSVSLETHSFEDIIQIVHNSRGIVGMHGSLLVISAFLKPGSILIELFPFAVNPAHYTPYKTLSQISGMDIVYSAWSNKERRNTKMHPDNAPELGGIQQLDKALQNEIKEQVEVPRHLCCDDPSWLFHIYQDTVVDIPEVIRLIKEAFKKFKNQSIKSVSDKPITNPSSSGLEGLTPSAVKNVKCKSIESSLSVTWTAPWNIQYLKKGVITFELWYQNTKENTSSSLILPEVTHHSISPISRGMQYIIWVRCKLDDVVGSFSDPVTCDS